MSNVFAGESQQYEPGCGACPTSDNPHCDRCDHHHDAGLPHCPNCGQAGGFHASWQLDQCPKWDEGTGRFARDGQEVPPMERAY
jgi:hypothetical protein